jgi:alkanesulfonate monooxygenase SsuD/methylene tetrahydromethanopterin reductase-like flavin-dependent oxidoreductase (luciferase family)
VTDNSPLHLAVALDGAGWHPAAWREPDAAPDRLFTAAYWAELAAEAERGLLDFITIEDSFGQQSARYDGPDPRANQVRGRLDAVLIASWIAPLTSHIGLVPTATVTHTEPFHVSKAIATLDYVSLGRAGWRVQGSRPWENSLFGRREAFAFRLEDYAAPEVQREVVARFDEAADFVEAAGHRARLDAAAGAEYASDAFIFTGTAAQLAELLLDWQGAGLSGFRLRPASVPRDLLHITRELVPSLQRNNSFRSRYTGTTLRERLGLTRPASRYAAVFTGTN